METLRLGTVPGSLKIVGVLLSVGGTMLVSFYKGKALHLWGPILQHHKYEQVRVANHHVRGTILLLGSSLSFACWYPIQVIISYTFLTLFQLNHSQLKFQSDVLLQAVNGQ